MNLFRPRALILLAALLLPTSSLFAGLGFCTQFRRGDVNVDTSVNIADAIKGLQHLFLGADLSCQAAADVDANFRLELADSIQLLHFLFLGGKPPSSPGPLHCGAGNDFEELSCEFYPPCLSGLEVLDLASFERFEYRQQPGLGFCPYSQRVYCVTIDRISEDIFQLDLSYQNDPAGQAPFCDGPGSVGCDGDCGDILRPATRNLTDDEISEMLALFSEVGFSTELDPICNCIAIDPCLIQEFRWDATRGSDFLCDGRRLDASKVQAIVEFLNGLRPGE